MDISGMEVFGSVPPNFKTVYLNPLPVSSQGSCGKEVGVLSFLVVCKEVEAGNIGGKEDATDS